MLKQIIKYKSQLWSISTTHRYLLTPLCAMATTAHQGSKHYNRLGLEKSPYLLQHATNPVNWYPWGQEAFEKAKTEGKIIFLSVGYSTCHWCHVMEKESFENEEIGKILNENFIPIKVDREERPDIDQVYMSFIQASTGQGGWPMNVWLTPDLKPVVGGTYFPPDDKYGRPGFKAVLLHIADNWKKNRTGIEKQGSNILNALAEHTSTTSSSNSTMPSEDITEMCYKTLEQTYDREKGGFGSAPKFPQPVNLRFLLRLCGPGSSEHGQTATDMCKHTLMMMSKGGIWDHIAKGFHRYSTDGDWHVPHFEKMLYDQAQLVVAYCEAYQVTKKERFATVVKDILDYVNNELSHKSGGFYSAMDADSLPSADSVEKKEGAFYVWKKDDIHSVLSAPLPGNNTKTDGDMFCHHFNVKPNGNVHPDKDPQGELKGENVLIELGDVGDTAKQFGLTANQVQDILGESKSKLLEVRKHRPVPHLDSKMVTAWNGLMISGFAKASQVIGDPAYKERALKAVQFVRQHLYDPELGILYRSCYTGDDGEVTQISTPIQGFADDYVFMVQGLIDAYEASFQDHLIHWAEQLQKKMDDLFWDNTSGGYFTSRDGDSSVILRVKGDQDGAEPSANSVAATNLLRLSSLLNNAEWKDRARRIFVAFQDRLQSMPHALPEMVRAFMSCQTHGIQIIVLGDREADDTRSLLECIHSHYLADRTLILADGSTDGYMYERLPLLSTLTKIDGKATAYVCRDFSCLPPVNSVQRLNELLKQEVGA